MPFVTDVTSRCSCIVLFIFVCFVLFVFVILYYCCLLHVDGFVCLLFFVCVCVCVCVQRGPTPDKLCFLRVSCISQSFVIVFKVVNEILVRLYLCLVRDEIK